MGKTNSQTGSESPNWGPGVILTSSVCAKGGENSVQDPDPGSRPRFDSWIGAGLKICISDIFPKWEQTALLNHCRTEEEENKQTPATDFKLPTERSFWISYSHISGLKHCTAGRALAWHTANPTSIFSIPYGSPSNTRTDHQVQSQGYP